MYRVNVSVSRWPAALLLLSVVITANPAVSSERDLAERPFSLENAAADNPDFEAFLDRLMRVESAGRDDAANPRSTALGAFQFIKSTFIEVTRRHFSDEVDELSDKQVLALRVDRSFARRAAAAYSRDNAEYLAEQGLQPTYGHLRLAFLVGPSAAARLLHAKADASVSSLLGASVVRANPFMRKMSASDLITRAARDVSDARMAYHAPPPRERPAAAARPGPRAVPRPKSTAVSDVKCNAKLAGCRRFIALRAKAGKKSKESAAPKKAGRKNMS